MWIAGKAKLFLGYSGTPSTSFARFRNQNYGKMSVMKKPILILLLVALAAVIVLAIVLLLTSSGETKIQNTEPAPRAENTKTQIAENENFLEKIGKSADTDITSIVERKNPLEVFEANLETNSKPQSLPAIPTLIPVPLPPVSLSEPAIPADFNTQNVGHMISAVWKVGLEQGFSEERLALIEKEVRKAVAATSTNYMEFFISEMNKTNQPVSAANPIVSFLTKLLAPKAYAQGSSQNFGGMVLFPFLCTCSGNWLVTMLPYPPSTVALITHYMGAQMYLNYNFPFSRFVLGKYTPGGGQCQFYVVFGCITLPSQGQTQIRIGTSGV